MYTMILRVQKRPGIDPVCCAARRHIDLERADVDVQAHVFKEIRIVKVSHRDREGHIVLVVVVDYLSRDTQGMFRSTAAPTITLPTVR